MSQGPKHTGDKAVNGITHAQGSDSILSYPSSLKPWEDRTLSPGVRLKAYKEFVLEKVSEILAAANLVSDDPAKVLEIRDSRAAQYWMKEATGLKGLSAEDFCSQIFLREIRELLGKNFLGAEEWRSEDIDVGEVPPIPASITRNLLESECPFHPGEKIKDTHLLVLVPETVNGERFSPIAFDGLCSSRKGSGEKLIADDQNWNREWKMQWWASIPQSQSEWILIPKSAADDSVVDPGRCFNHKNTNWQERIHEDFYPEYRQIKVVELMTAVLLNDLVNGGPRLLEQSYLRCMELAPRGDPICVGSFDARGLTFNDSYDRRGHEIVGRAIARNLRT
ncbi:MAG: hypothetical protein RL518_1649 [Pseudomonadota bacterium]|jgi:hypothetical protein